MIALIQNTLRVMVVSCVVELRAFDVRLRSARMNHSGYYDDLNLLATDAARLDGLDAESICITLNELDPQLLARRANHCDVAKRNLTADSDIIGRRWILIDVDPVRCAGISSTDDEHRAALTKGAEIRDWLAARGISAVMGDSGNGCHLLIRIDLPNDPDAKLLVQRFTEAVGFRFDDASVKVDKSTGNAARVVKLYGTMARKGSNMPDRPHRRSALVYVPSDLSPVPTTLLEEIARAVPGGGTYVPPPAGTTFDLGRWLTDHQLEVANEGPWQEGYKYILRTCPWNPAHDNQSAYVLRMKSGALVAGCHHDSCRGNGWRELRALYEPLRQPAAGSVARPPTKWPAPLEGAAFHGLAGRTVRLIEPATEADAAALLVQLLCGFGNVIGRSAHWFAEETCHYTNLFVLVVGATARGRKGTAWDRIRAMLNIVDPGWCKERILTGLTSGEGLIWHVRDAQGDDWGVDDKRLLVVENEFASPLKVMQREGNTLSPVLRRAWDTGDLATLAKNQPAKATGAHISVIGHISHAELARLLKETEMANGFANRFLFVCARRSKNLPRGGQLDPVALAALQKELAKSVSFGRTVGLHTRTPDAEKYWDQLYNDLNVDRPGMLGAIIGRGPAQVMRVASLLALLDRADQISVAHLQAAAAVWRYSVASAEYCFGNSLGDPTADKILACVQDKPGMSRTEIRDTFQRHKSVADIDNALRLLEDAVLVERVIEPGSGRPTERWFPTGTAI